jgi:hypothetical protein
LNGNGTNNFLGIDVKRWFPSCVLINHAKGELSRPGDQRGIRITLRSNWRNPCSLASRQCSSAISQSRVGDISGLGGGINETLRLTSVIFSSPREPVGSFDCPSRVNGSVPHFGQHTYIDQGQNQSPQGEEDGSVRSTAIVLATSPPATWPSDYPPESPSNLTKALTVVLAVALCAILTWFGIPALFTGMDQPSFPLLLLGVATILIEIFVILYTIDMVSGYPLYVF